MAREEIKVEIKKILESNENEIICYQNTGDYHFFIIPDDYHFLLCVLIDSIFSPHLKVTFRERHHLSFCLTVSL